MKALFSTHSADNIYVDNHFYVLMDNNSILKIFYDQTKKHQVAFK
jgi:hypothetical protein